MKIDLSDFNKAIKKVDKQLKFATAVALTKTAIKVKDKEKAQIKQSFDRPKPFTINSIYSIPASYKQPVPTALVGIKDKAKGTPAAKYLQAQIFGGNRKLKKAEAALKGQGILPPGYYIVPGNSIRLNRFGNMTKGQIGKAMSAGTSGSQFFVSNRTGKTSHLPRGVWQRKGAKGKKLSLFVKFVSKTSYKQRYDFYGTAKKEASRIITDEFKTAYDYALRTAR